MIPPVLDTVQYMLQSTMLSSASTLTKDERCGDVTCLRPPGSLKRMTAHPACPTNIGRMDSPVVALDSP